MRKFGNRTIKVNKANLIAKILENKLAHIKAYEEAVIAYKQEALKQLNLLFEKANNGELNLNLQLTSPINNSENYDKIIDMFEWEVEDIVVLEEREFNEYIQDETDFAVTAKFSNSVYLSR